MKKKLILLFTIIFLLLPLTGCWGQKEINELGIVQVMGVDLEPDGNYRISVLAVIPIGGLQESLDLSGVWLGSAVGKSINDASKNLRNVASKRLVWIDNRIILIGEELAREGVDEILDYFMRNREIRYRNYVMVSEGKALDIMSIPADAEANLPEELLGIIQNVQDWTKAYVPDLNAFLNCYLDQGIETVAGRLTYSSVDFETYSTAKENYGEVIESEKKKVIADRGCAVFKGDKLVDFLGNIETRGYRLITGEINAGAITINDQEQMVSMEIRNVKSNITAEVDNDITFTIHLKMSGDIIENASDHNIINQATIDQLEKKFEKEIVKELEYTVTQAQNEHESDFLGFGRVLYRRHPDVWREIEQDWDTIFPNVTVKYDVDVSIDRMGERF